MIASDVLCGRSTHAYSCRSVIHVTKLFMNHKYVDLPAGPVSSSCDGRSHPVLCPQCSHYLSRHTTASDPCKLLFVHSALSDIHAKLFSFKLSTGEKYMLMLTVLTICIKVLPNFQETSSVQVMERGLHRSREK